MIKESWKEKIFLYICLSTDAENWVYEFRESRNFYSWVMQPVNFTSAWLISLLFRFSSTQLFQISQEWRAYNRIQGLIFTPSPWRKWTAVSNWSWLSIPWVKYSPAATNHRLSSLVNATAAANLRGWTAATWYLTNPLETLSGLSERYWAKILRGNF